MSSYTIVDGDTFELISRKISGTIDRAGQIARGNPGVIEPLQPGQVITVPDVVPPSVRLQGSGDAVTLQIDGRRFRFWSDISVRLSLDTISSIEFRAPFDPMEPTQRETFQPFTFKPVTVSIGDRLLFTGTMVNVRPSLDALGRTVSVSCYSLPGVLNDCNAPASAFPIEYADVDLRAITTRLTDIFGLTVVFNGSPGKIFDQVRIEPEQKIFNFLTRLAQQRNLVITSGQAGELLFNSVTDGSAQPKAELNEGSSPVISVSTSFDAQQYYSHITGIAPIALGRIGTQYTSKNPRLTSVLRPLTFNAKDSIDANIPENTMNKISRMFGNMAAYSISVDTWRDQFGELWATNTVIRVMAPGVMIYKPYNLIIRNVDFEQSPTGRIAFLTAVLPGAFSGGIPEVLPWDC